MTTSSQEFSGRILVTGAGGFVGRNFLDLAKDLRVLAPNRSELDLFYRHSLVSYIRENSITHIVHLAAKCGGIGINKDNPAVFMHDNLLMGMNVLEAARICGVRKVINLGTVCSYPKFARVPFVEQDIWSGYPEETNAPYGIAKKAIMELGVSYSKQYGLDVTNLVPVNMAGRYDNFDLYSSHVIPAMIRKFEEGGDEVVLWGTGTASREFLDARDCCSAIIKALNITTGPEPINIGTGNEITIKDLAELIMQVGDYNTRVSWDSSKPDGQPRRCLNIERAKKLLDWTPKTPLRTTILDTISWYRGAKL